jgi:hypothetical protein
MSLSGIFCVDAPFLPMSTRDTLNDFRSQNTLSPAQFDLQLKALWVLHECENITELEVMDLYLLVGFCTIVRVITVMK